MPCVEIVLSTTAYLPGDSGAPSGMVCVVGAHDSDDCGTTVVASTTPVGLPLASSAYTETLRSALGALWPASSPWNSVSATDCRLLVLVTVNVWPRECEAVMSCATPNPSVPFADRSSGAAPVGAALVRVTFVVGAQRIA